MTWDERRRGAAAHYWVRTQCANIGAGRCRNDLAGDAVLDYLYVVQAVDRGLSEDGA